MRNRILIRQLMVIGCSALLGSDAVVGQIPTVPSTSVTSDLTSNPLGNYLKGPYSAAVLEGIWYNSAFPDHKADMHKAMYWFEEATKEGSLDGQAFLGTFYLYGHGVVSDYTKAYNLIKPAADQGCLMGELMCRTLNAALFSTSQDTNRGIAELTDMQLFRCVPKFMPNPEFPY
jgi:TPR repeat protein